MNSDIKLTSAPIKELLTWEDLGNLGWDTSSIGKKYAEKYGMYPDAMYLNGAAIVFEGGSIVVELRSGSAQNQIFKTLGPITHGNPKITPHESEEIREAMVVTNEGEEEVEEGVSWKQSRKRSLTLSASVTVGIKFSSKINIEIFEAGGEASISATVGASATIEKTDEIDRTIKVKTPGKSKRTIKCLGSWVDWETPFSAPITIESNGSFSSALIVANFSKRVGPGEGHYYINMPLNEILGGNGSYEMNGIIKNEGVATADFNIGEAEKMTAEELQMVTA